ncbi:MAG TPA: polyamine ABC transporter ATP-binding protein [Peptococcaceae bacterium]|nr:polyamine ABC transporter ATP-binding protein [Peptococcaceae bacterium]
MRIELINVNKFYRETAAIKDVSLVIESGEMMALLGPSGCGKSTLLRMIAGLVDVSSGQVLFDEMDVSSLPAQKRNASMVFQSYALFPHMNVFENIAFGLKIKKIGKGEIARRVANILEIVELSGLGSRNVQELSGGQRQRVALGRAIIMEPDILLLDEPLSNLDEKLRVTMRQSIKKLQRNLGITSVYVTHDQEEAMSIADRITVMDMGRILQTGTPKEIYFKPQSRFVAEFVGQANFFERKGDRSLILGQELVLPASFMDGYAMLRPENIHFSETGIQGCVQLKEELGLITRYQIDATGHPIIVDALSTQVQKSYDVGETMQLSFDIDAVIPVQNSHENWRSAR